MFNTFLYCIHSSKAFATTQISPNREQRKGYGLKTFLIFGLIFLGDDYYLSNRMTNGSYSLILSSLTYYCFRDLYQITLKILWPCSWHVWGKWHYGVIVWLANKVPPITCNHTGARNADFVGFVIRDISASMTLK